MTSFEKAYLTLIVFSAVFTFIVWTRMLVQQTRQRLLDGWLVDRVAEAWRPRVVAELQRQIDGEWSNEGWRLVVAFPDQSTSFAHGVEAGKLWGRLSADAGPIELPTMTANREVLRRIAEYQGWRLEQAPADIEGWDLSIFTKIRPAGKLVNPHGLRTV